MAFTGTLGWPFDLTSHFRVQYAMGLAGTAVWFLFRKQYKPAAGASLFCLLNLAVIAPLYKPQPVSAVSGPVYRAVSLNVHEKNDSYEQVLTFLHAENPDFIVLVEATDTWLAAMKPLTTEYPYVHRAYFKGYQSRLIYSRYPFMATWQVADRERPSAIAQFNLNGQLLMLIAAHPNSPLRPRNALLHQEQLHHLAYFIAGQTTPVLLLGDLNTTPWSAVFQQFLQESGLQNGRNGFGIYPSWPAPFPLIPIDHALISSGIVIHHLQTGPNIGSDHYPLIIDFSLAGKTSD